MNQDNKKAAIWSLVQSIMDGVMQNVLVNDSFVKKDHYSQRPLFAALVPDEIFKGSHFERRFVTPFNKVWEELAVLAANEGLGFGEMGRAIRGTVKTERLRRIQAVLHSKDFAEPNWDTEIAFILGGKGEDIPVTVVCDVYAEDTTNKKRYAFELKSPTPNSDITKVSKEKILKLYSMEPLQIDGAYYALPYNPYGRREDYSWSFPGRWFNMKEDSVVLISDEFWEKMGGLGTYQAFIEAVNEIGKDYRERIYREYLEIEPPAHAEQMVL